MATTGTMILSGSLLAAADLSTQATSQFHLVSGEADGVDLTGANGMAQAVLLNYPEEDGVCELCVLGITKAKAGGTITRGDRIKAAAGGEVVTAVAADSASGYVCGWAMESAVDGDIFQIFFFPNHPTA